MSTGVNWGYRSAEQTEQDIQSSTKVPIRNPYFKHDEIVAGTLALFEVCTAL